MTVIGTAGMLPAGSPVRAASNRPRRRPESTPVHLIGRGMGSDTVSIGWAGDGAHRMEIARVQRRGRGLVGEGVQLGRLYVLHYRLEPDRLTVRLDGDEARGIDLGDADFFDL